MTTVGLDSRKTAHAVLMRVFRQRETIEQAMASQHALLDALSPSDRGFVYQMVMSAVRYHGGCTALLTQFLREPLKDTRLDITLCLHLGIVQLLVLHSPAHAVVDTSVTLAKSLHNSFGGLVNATLKNIAKTGAEAWENIGHGETSTPDWLLKSWSKAYGSGVAQEIATAHLAEPPTDITVKHPAEASAWAEKLGGILLPSGSIRLTNHAPIPTLEGFAEGAWWVQELAASLPVKLMGDIAGKTVLDICAAPGGKTAQLAAAGAIVTAMDISPKRLERLTENLERLQLNAEVIAADAHKWQPEQQFDHILLDAPCSATGTLRRHPEIAILRSSSDVTRLINVQHKMLRRAWDWLKPEGTLTYVVCSLQPEEGKGQSETFMTETGTILLPYSAEASGLPAEFFTTKGELRTLPSSLTLEGAVDGFYAARFIKKA